MADQAQWEHDIDETKDYYEALGVTSSATQEELKAAYVQLALIHHPDTALSQEVDAKQQTAAFVKISEAWSVLSRPEVRKRYDTLRNVYLGVRRPLGGMGSSSLVDAGTPVGFTTQKENWGRVQQKAGATAEDTRERMRMERFRTMPLDAKKIRRAQPVASLFGSAFIFALPLFAGILAYGTYKWSKRSNSRQIG